MQRPPTGPAEPAPVTPRPVAADEVAAFVAETLLSRDRTLPVVAITTSTSTGLPWVDPEQMAQRLGDGAEVVVLETGDATWTLSEVLPDMLAVYGGAVRIWWPGLTEGSNPYDHPLLFVRSAAQGERVLRQVLEAVRPDTDTPADPWRRIADEYGIGDVVWGLVDSVKPFGVFVELLPGAAGLVRKSEVDWTFVEDPGAFVTPGEQVAVQILGLDAIARRAELSIKRAWNRKPRAPIAPVPGGRPVLSAAPRPVPPEASQVTPAADPTVLRLHDEIETLREDRADLLRRLRDLQKQLRGATDRIDQLERLPGTAEDPASSENTFLLAVRLAYARQFGEGERHDHPLRQMRVGRQFLDRLRGLEGVSLEKVVEVCAQVAADRAHAIPAREVHRLHTADRGGDGVERPCDGAKAWRCSLQDHTPAARRLHWWSVPGPDGGSVEFASVGVHDDFGIPD
jgi:hypothetical protein